MQCLRSHASSQTVRQQIIHLVKKKKAFIVSTTEFVGLSMHAPREREKEDKKKKKKTSQVKSEYFIYPSRGNLIELSKAQLKTNKQTEEVG